MQTNLLWTGREYYSLENCRVHSNENGNRIASTIIGLYTGDLYQVDYQIDTNARWETVSVAINFFKNNIFRQFHLEKNTSGNWLLDGQINEEFSGCTDVDLPLTPFTNTLPIRRLNMVIGNQYPIKVIYLDLLEDRLSAVSQLYTRLSETVFHYENVPNDFEADIIVDEDGLVADYPELFVRTARRDFSMN
ncbi:hypothetical protein SAMN05216327_109268 [Dyadobacter sp. SG02]|uniref:putative glycolipid-binding domain-containing protein n=1 Tax=Dyadobacter sp. SG02 TaxID=1855291 RepID=UPI0008B8F6AA|nr:putative glycolipid-binding domain-containing protein [Dyadobacter sp. SG02]SEJ40123.1 hypothetical protein SAMN05216327_109268 [Dyadobacter sp. SG02]